MKFQKYLCGILKHMTIERICSRIIHLGFILLFAIVPLLLTPWNYELFEYNKMMAVYALTVIIVGAWLMKMAACREIRIVRTPLDIPIVLFVTSLFVSSLFSIDPHVSWFGYYSRFNGGMLSVISYVMLFYAFVSNWGAELGMKKNQTAFLEDKEKQSFSILNSLFFILKVALSASMVVAIYGVLERFGIDQHLWVQDVQNRVFSTLGQPNWLAAYVIALIPMVKALGVVRIKNQEIKTKQRIKSWATFSIFIVLNALLFTVILYTRSRSGLFAFAVMDVIFWGLILLGSFIHPRTVTKHGVNSTPKPSEENFFHRKVFHTFFVLHCAFFLVVFLNGTHVDTIDKYVTLESWKGRLFQQATSPQPVPQNVTTEGKSGTLLEYGGTESGLIRKYVWEGALNAWRSSTKTTLIGTGTETFAFAFFRYKPVLHNLTSEWDFLYNKAHNEYLNYLATTGLFGLGSYLLFIGGFILWMIKMLLTQWSFYFTQDKPSSSDVPFDIYHLSFIIALFAGWLSILVTNFFGFSVVVTNLFLFLFPAMIFVLVRNPNPSLAGRQVEAHISLRLNRNVNRFFYFTILLASLTLLVLLSRIWYADTLFAGGYRYSHAGQFSAAYPLLTRAVDLNDNEPLYHDEYAATLAGLAAEAMENKQATIGAELMTKSLKESDRALSVSPENVNFWKTRTKIYYAFANADAAWNKAAIEALTQASILSPTDPKIFYNLAILYGREADNKKAIELLQKTITLKPNYRDATYALWVFYTETKQAKLAKEVLETYLSNVDPGDKDFLERIK